MVQTSYQAEQSSRESFLRKPGFACPVDLFTEFVFNAICD